MGSLHDARLAARNLFRTPGFTVVVVLTLALGIGATTAIFSVVHAVVLSPASYPDPQQLVRITSELRSLGADDTGVSPPELFDYQARTDIFAGVAGLLPVSANVTSGGTAERVEMMLTSWNYFAVLGVPPLHGRVFQEDDDVPGVANLAVVSHGFWQRRLGADPAAVGRTIIVDEDPIQVVGVMPRGFRHPGRTLQTDVELWSPAGFRAGGGAAGSRSRRRLEGALARLQSEVTLGQAQARLDAYGASTRGQFAADYPAEQGWNPRLVPLREDLVGGVATAMFVLLAGVGLLLLVACVNVANLILARSSARWQEMAVRQALGASRARLFNHLVVESAVLSAIGTGLGVLVASWGVRGLVALAPTRIPRLDEVRIDGTALAVAALVAVTVTIVFATLATLQVRGDTSTWLKRGTRGGGADKAGARTRNAFVVVEIAIAMVLLVTAGLFVRTVVDLLNVPVGFTTDRVLTARLTLPRPNDPARAEYLDPARRAGFYREVLRRVQAVSGIEHAALSSQVPLGGFNPPILLEFDGTGVAAVSRPGVHLFQVSPEYFDTLGIPLVKGRGFTTADRRGGEEVALVSAAAARLFWPGLDPVGQRIRYAAGTPWITVVGVAGDVLNRRLTEPPQPLLYRPLEQSSDLTAALIVRAGDGLDRLGESIGREIRAIDPDVPLYGVRSMDELIGAQVAQRRFLMRLLVTFGVVATVLALLGIYGVIAFAVSQRTREIGIRMAIGARQSDVSRMFLTGGIALAAAGVTIGLPASVLLTRLVQSQLFGVHPADPVVLAVASLTMTVIAAGAAYLPARRAAEIDPVIALRAE